MRTPTQDEMDIWFSARRELAVGVEAAIKEAKRQKKSVEVAVRNVINTQNWKLRAESLGYRAEPKKEAEVEQMPKIDQVLFACVLSFVMGALFMGLAQ